ncbi:hypothetical protein P168DRAFT_75181 [Aspergillus campestris IBT 28561]|uniref:Uncharacterized protein n=1 Tax=Aspergillus campestris (strain IBT 28561) TaxID=1392248 RepID=A0A2I1CRM2_ASPC2|nr:uncharacterized protein P168DRAFT_75181 [Aspergillus campestris IBT 28561]PKY00267.1 hypothetical protein P168DRAFT_75181 [Aspergillus campestris IBT 28561]
MCGLVACRNVFPAAILLGIYLLARPLSTRMFPSVFCLFESLFLLLFFFVFQVGPMTENGIDRRSDFGSFHTDMAIGVPRHLT